MKLDVLQNFEKKEKIFLIICALYVIVAECLLTYCKTPLCYYEVTIAGVICILMLVKSRKLYIGIREILVLGTAATYCIFTGWYGLFSSWHVSSHVVLVWLAFIYMTKFFMDEGFNRGIEEKVMWGIIIILTVGFTIHAVVDTAVFLSQKDYHRLDLLFKNITKYGRGDQWRDCFINLVIPRTHLGYFLIPIFSCTLPACISDINLKHKVAIVAIDILSLFGIMCSGMGRAPFAMFLIMLIFQYVIIKVVENGYISLISRKIRLRAILVVLLLSVIGCIFVSKNDELMQIVSHNMSRNGGISHNVRWEYQMEVLRNILKYPWGIPTNNPRDVYDFGTSHNVWLDMALYAGIIPFALFSIYTIYTVVDTFRFVRGSAKCLLKLILVGFYIGYLISYGINPAFNSSIEFIVPWLMSNTIMYSYNKRQIKVAK